jgi:hypothetical protein
MPTTDLPFKGATLNRILAPSPHDADTLYFDTDEGVFVMTHNQDCCEHVRIIEVHGDPVDLVDTLAVHAEEAEDDGNNVPNPEGTWTFYRICTPKGDITIRWLGESNGYYSESVDVEKVQRSNLPRRLVQWRGVR